MVSIVVCSLQTDRYVFERNIEKTIGCVYELIFVDNSENKFSISEAYNLGIDKSKFDVILFVHEDVLFHTTKWGKLLVDYFNFYPNLGAIGVAGALHKTKAPSAWWDSPGNGVIYIIQHINGQIVKLNNSGWLDNENFQEVVVIDGVFMAIRKTCRFRFDTSIPGFHCYDLNLSVELKQKGYKIFVTREILIEHFSLGEVNKSWVVASHAFHKKFSKYLPLRIPTINAINNDLEFKNLEMFVQLALKYRLRRIVVFYLPKLILKNPGSIKYYIRRLYSILTS